MKWEANNVRKWEKRGQGKKNLKVTHHWKVILI